MRFGPSVSGKTGGHIGKHGAHFAPTDLFAQQTETRQSIQGNINNQQGIFQN